MTCILRRSSVDAEAKAKVCLCSSPRMMHMRTVWVLPLPSSPSHGCVCMSRNKTVSLSKWLPRSHPHPHPQDWAITWLLPLSSRASVNIGHSWPQRASLCCESPKGDSWARFLWDPQGTLPPVLPAAHPVLGFTLQFSNLIHLKNILYYYPKKKSRS